MKLPNLCGYHRGIYQAKRDRLRHLHKGTLRTIRDEAASVARQCPQCVATTG